LFVFVLLAASGGAAAGTAAATAETHPLDKDDEETDGEEPSKDSEWSGDSHHFSKGIPIDGLINE
jgi:hypothetical protein